MEHKKLNLLHLNQVNNKGFTLISLLVAILIGTVLVLTIGVMASISLRSHQKTIDTGNVYMDVAYGLKRAQLNMREAYNFEIVAQSGNWIGDRLRVDKDGFFGVLGLYNNNNETYEFVYVPIETDENTRSVMLSVAPTDTINLHLKEIEVSGTQVKTVGIWVDGTKGDISFRFPPCHDSATCNDTSNNDNYFKVRKRRVW